ncbi:MAG: exodeoxyribonuclease VII large subunit [Bacteroidetes bacterium]|nr:exodeoxyribonuclease VII large subunit [Bacteroidota bacterium]
MSEQPLSLSQLTGMIKASLRDRFGGQYYYVVAEVSNFSARKGVQYMQLIEKEEESGKLMAEISAMIFQDGIHEIEEFEKITGQAFGNGIKVLVQVSVVFHEVYGLKLTIHRIDPSFTIGELRRQREITLRRLCEENPDAVKFLHNRYYTRNQTLVLPAVISRIAIVSSEFSAGLQDFVHTLENNPFGYRFSMQLFSTKVQNDDQGRQTVERFIEIYHRKDEFDIVVLVRGGGSQTDLLMFDAYPLARAIARFPIPVFCGLGHLKDISVADLMAHSSEKTPTRVAEKIIEHNRSFEQAVLELRNSIIIKAQQFLSEQKEELSVLSSGVTSGCNLILAESRDVLFRLSSLVSKNSHSAISRQYTLLSAAAGRMAAKPLIRIERELNAIGNFSKGIPAESLKFLKQQKGLTEHYVTVFKLLSPERTLSRGFALVRKGGKIITDAAGVRKGDELDILLGKDLIQTKVSNKSKSDGYKNDL